MWKQKKYTNLKGILQKADLFSSGIALKISSERLLVDESHQVLKRTEYSS